MYKDEQWKQIEDLPYEISNYGRVKSHNVNKGTKTALIDGTIGANGYKLISLCGKKVYVHRLVAYYFVEGYKKGLHVNHKDLNKLNNHYSNLEWCSNEDNVKHAWGSGVYRNKIGRPFTDEEKDKKREDSTLRKRVLNTETGEIYRSLRELAEILNSDSSGLSKQIRKGRPHKGILYTYI